MTDTFRMAIRQLTDTCNSGLIDCWKTHLKSVTLGLNFDIICLNIREIIQAAQLVLDWHCYIIFTQYWKFVICSYFHAVLSYTSEFVIHYKSFPNSTVNRFIKNKFFYKKIFKAKQHLQIQRSGSSSSCNYSTLNFLTQIPALQKNQHRH